MAGEPGPLGGGRAGTRAAPARSMGTMDEKPNSERQPGGDPFEGDRAWKRHDGGLRYTRLEDGVRPYPQGSVRLPDGSVVPGYPSIGRVRSLERELPMHFSGPFQAEEKMDGYNVRIFRHGDELYGLSRGGFVCPFTTDRLPDLLDPAIFQDEPDLVLCAEVAGPETPYMEGSPPDVTEDVALFVFDMTRRGPPAFLPYDEKVERLERYGLPSVRRFGEFHPDTLEPLRELILEIDREGREGLVLKSEDDGGTRAKYGASRANIVDIRLMASALLDVPPEYFTNRLLRTAVFMMEHELEADPEVERELGSAFLTGLMDAVRQARTEGTVGHPFRCRFRKRDNALWLMDFLAESGGARTRFADDVPRREGDYWVVEFERIQARMTGTLRQIFDGPEKREDG